MKFDELDSAMRLFEQADDRPVAPGYVVARIDGRSFTRLTKVTHDFEAPFDVRFRDYIVTTTTHLMQCGFRVLYGYTQSDEISILISPEERCYQRRARKWISILAGEASAKFSIELDDPAAFDCRLCELPTEHDAVDYFRWRAEDARRNALNGHCYWALRKEGLNGYEASIQLVHLSRFGKLKLLSDRGIDFDTVPAWQKRGSAVVWSSRKQEGSDPRTGEEVVARRPILVSNYELPEGDQYSLFLHEIIKGEKR